ncbi:MAG: hypothetical protein ACRDAP_00490, partial [Shewanella sp.]
MRRRLAASAALSGHWLTHAQYKPLSNIDYVIKLIILPKDSLINGSSPLERPTIAPQYAPPQITKRYWSPSTITRCVAIGLAPKPT